MMCSLHAALLATSTAALPKERKRYNKKCTEITKNLSKLVAQYNLLVEQYNAIPHQQHPLQPTTLDAVKRQEFCWVNESAGEHLVTRAQLELPSEPV
jgi:hypothetical protein